MKDCGSVNLEPDEQITLITDDGAEYDVARKEWGFYATPSLNGRLASFGLRGVLVHNQVTGRYFILLVQRGRETEFKDYLVQEHCEVVTWLDNTESLDQLRSACDRYKEGALPNHGN
jgi:hypothetical protein